MQKKIHKGTIRPLSKNSVMPLTKPNIRTKAIKLVKQKEEDLKLEEMKE